MTAALAASSVAWADYSSLVVFGDSLSDAGNNAVAVGGASTPLPISGNGFEASLPYASGRYSNGPVWAEDLAASLHVPLTASLLGGTDFAFGGATTSGQVVYAPVPNMMQQEAMFLAAVNNNAPSSALYVIAGGANNAQAALATIAGAPGSAAAVIQQAASIYASDTVNMVKTLENAGATHIVVWNTPDLGVTPRLMSAGAGAAQLATLLTGSMNSALAGALAGDSHVMLFDFFSLVDDTVADKGNGQFVNVTDACAAVIGCDPSQYLFWDGVHPTAAGHALIAAGMLALVSVPEPSSAWLLGLGLLLIGPGAIIRARRVTATAAVITSVRSAA